MEQLHRARRGVQGGGSRAPDTARGAWDTGPPARPVLARIQARLAHPAGHRAGVDTAVERPAEPRLVAAATGRGADFYDFEFTCHAGSRQFKLFLPRVRPPSAMPLVVMLHGCKQSPDDFALGTRMNERALREGFAVAYPAQVRLNNVARCWNWFRPSDQRRGAGEPAIIASLALDLVKRYGFDRRRVYIAGLSAGGAMAAIVGEAYPDVFAAVGVHSSPLTGVAVGVVSAIALMRHGRREPAGRMPRLARPPTTPVIVFHGDADSTVHPRNATDLYARSARMTTDGGSPPDAALRESTESGSVSGGRAYTRSGWQDATGVARSELWVVHDLGHAWSGGDGRGSYTDPAGPDASAEMVRFFLANRLPDTPAAR